MKNTNESPENLSGNSSFPLHGTEKSTETGDTGHAAEGKTASDVPITVTPVYDNGGKKNKMQPFIIAAAIIVIIIIAVFITVKAVGKKHESGPASAPVEAEPSGDIKSEEPQTEYTFNNNIEIDFSGLSEEYANDLSTHRETTEVTISQKPSAFTITESFISTTKPSAQNQTTAKHYTEVTTVKTTQPSNSQNGVIQRIDAFFKGKYYIDGVMFTGNESSPVEMAMDGQNYEIFTEIEGMDIAIMQLNGKTYMLNFENKKYLELTSAIKKTIGLDDDSFNLGFNDLKFDASAPSGVYEATCDGKKATCYTYADEKTSVDFYVVGDEIVQLELTHSDSSANTKFKIDEFSVNIPSGMLTLNGYSKTNMLSFFGSLM